MLSKVLGLPSYHKCMANIYVVENKVEYGHNNEEKMKLINAMQTM